MSRKGAAFTLIELMVVLIIIGIIIAIVLPALSGARRAARKTATDGMLRQITNAVGAFQNDNRRMPGHFTAKEIGHPDNATPAGGFDTMKNVMMDLAGAQVVQTGGVLLGPTATSQIRVEPNSLGLPGAGNTKAYWIPDKNHLKAQNEASQQVGTAENIAWPSVIDEWKNPIIAWVIDDTAVGTIKTVDQFARVDSSAGAPARFYWASNGAFLTAQAFGNRAIDQAANSALGSPATPDLTKSIAGMLGNPSNPYKDPVLVGGGMPYPIPASARAPFMAQSAGADGVFVGKSDRGFKQFKHGFIDYRMNFAPDVDAAISATNQWTDKSDKGTGYDIMPKFDDLLIGGGN